MVKGVGRGWRVKTGPPQRAALGTWLASGNDSERSGADSGYWCQVERGLGERKTGPKETKE